MEPTAQRKYHVAPLARQKRVVDRLLKARRFRNLTEFIRAAIDHYLDNLGRPSLSRQAQQMADDWEAAHPAPGPAARAQARSMASEEGW